MRLSDTFTRAKQELPASPAPVRMYFCGPTVYARAHIGNARPFVIGMWLARWLRARGYDATLVHNITDINDKIYDAAPGASAELAERATQWYLEDTKAFGLGMPDHQPRASELVPEIVAAIEELIDRGFAYEVDGDVYYRVARFAEYGRLSGQRPDQVEDQEPNARKEDPRDFALWKANKPGEDTSWDSPWGRGRPGWHIECSVMAEQLLGPVFEIHGGGLDLVFPHHENEIAQSCCAFEARVMANYWMHNGFLQVEGQKMSKSLGNFVTINELLATDTFGGRAWPGPSLRFAMLGTHYRQPIDWTVAGLKEAHRVAQDWSAFVEKAEPGEVPLTVLDALLDDLNTPKTIAEMHALRKAGRAEELKASLGLLGIGLVAPETVALSANVRVQVQTLIDARNTARARKDWKESDRIRDELLAMDIVVKDNRDGTTSWEAKR